MTAHIPKPNTAHKEPGSPAACAWPGDDPLYLKYHDEEWGMPILDEQALFELLCLEGAQAGLSWITVLRKRCAYRDAFHNFDSARCSRMSDLELDALRSNPGIVRHQGKILSVRSNAIAHLRLLDSGIGLAQTVWGCVGGSPLNPLHADSSTIQAVSDPAKDLSKKLKKAGFLFCGPTICHAYLQACGAINDHLAGCPARKAVLAAQALAFPSKSPAA